MTFATTTDLLPHQADAVAKLLPSRVGALFAEMGTGKSRMLIELAKLRAGKRKIDRVIWLCPTSLKPTVVAEILKHTDCGEGAIHVFDEDTDAQSVPQDRLWYVVGIEGIGSSTRLVSALNAVVTEACLVAMDESTYIKGPFAKRTQRLTSIARRARYRIVLTGTPVTQGVVDLFSQFTFLSPKILGYNSFYSFSRNHLEYHVDRRTGRTTGRIVRSHNKEYLAAKIAPYSYQITKDECLTLPAKLRETRWTDPTPQQVHLYEAVKDEILNDGEEVVEVGEDGERKVVFVERGDISDLKILRLFTALQSISCGYYRGERIPSNRVFHVVETCRRLAPDEKVVIWAKYRMAVEDIVAALVAEFGRETVQRFHGGLSPAEKEAELAAWRAAGRFLVATQQSGGHGLTLVEASTMIFFANGFKYSERVQAEDRIHRIGQTRPCTYVDIHVRLPIDARIDQALDRKSDVARGFRQQVESFRRRGLKSRIREAIKAL